MTRITTMEARVERVKGFLDEMVRYTGEKEDLIKDFADVLHLIIPGDGHRLLTLGDWRHSPAPRARDHRMAGRRPRTAKRGISPGGGKSCRITAGRSTSTPSTCWTTTGRSPSSTSSSMRRTRRSRSSRTGTPAVTREWRWPASWAAEARCPGPAQSPHASRRAARPPTQWRQPAAGVRPGGR